MHRIVFVSGLSGAGKSQAMKTFEDLGFYCVDNLPPALAPSTLALLEEGQRERIAVSLDVRTGGALGDARTALDQLQSDGAKPDVLFLDARDDTLIRRYSETRRRHPFSSDGTLVEAIAAEREALAPIRERSTRVIDTSALTHGELKQRILSAYAPDRAQRQLSVAVTAFGFKFGIPVDADLLFDVRFLRNPNYVPALKPLTGQDAAVGAFIQEDAAYSPFIRKLFDFVDFLVPLYVGEGKSHLTIAIGCTGGRHRSVFVAQQLCRHLTGRDETSLHLNVRDAERRA